MSLIDGSRSSGSAGPTRTRRQQLDEERSRSRGERKPLPPADRRAERSSSLRARDQTAPALPRFRRLSRFLWDARFEDIGTAGAAAAAGNRVMVGSATVFRMS